MICVFLLFYTDGHDTLTLYEFLQEKRTTTSIFTKYCQTTKIYFHEESSRYMLPTSFLAIFRGLTSIKVLNYPVSNFFFFFLVCSGQPWSWTPETVYVDSLPKTKKRKVTMIPRKKKGYFFFTPSFFLF